MPDIQPTSTLTALLPTLLVAFLAGSVTQLVRQLSRPQLRPLRHAAALTVAAGIAALTVAALLGHLGQTAPELLLAAACITGWSGPGILARLGRVVETLLGLGEGPGGRRRGDG